MTALKYLLLAGGSGLWLNGLVGQLDSLAASAKYVAISALILIASIL